MIPGSLHDEKTIEMVLEKQKFTDSLLQAEAMIRKNALYCMHSVKWAIKGKNQDYLIPSM